MADGVCALVDGLRTLQEDIRALIARLDALHQGPGRRHLHFLDQKLPPTGSQPLGSSLVRIETLY